jgi:hypothetical protein
MTRARTDRRYTITLEWCGYERPRWVVRFCGDWCGQRATRREARALRQQGPRP